MDLLQYLEQAEHGQLVDISIHLTEKINSCITVSRSRMPSSAEGSMWSAFHQLRSSSEIQRVWCRFVARSIPPNVNCEESQLVLQLLLDRILKKLLENQAKASKKYEISDYVRPLTSLECNAVRYMAGYVAIKLLKKYQKPTKHQELKMKHQYFIKVLHQMQATDQPGDVDTLSDYTGLWSELIDRGGLYHISDELSIKSTVVCVCTSVHTCMCVCVYMHVCMSFHVHVSACVFASIRVYMCAVFFPLRCFACLKLLSSLSDDT